MKKGLVVLLAIIFATASARLISADIHNVSPYGGERFTNHSTCNINWRYIDSSDHVNIYLWNGSLSQWTTIATNVWAVQNSYSWYISTSNYGDYFRIKIKSVNHPEKVNFSTGYFSISAAPIVETVPEVVNKDNIVTVYPNPMSNEINIKSEQSLIETVTIMGVDGRIMLSKDNILSNQHTLNISSLSQGEYLVEVRTAQKERVVKKIIVNR